MKLKIGDSFAFDVAACPAITPTSPEELAFQKAVLRRVGDTHPITYHKIGDRIFAERNSNYGIRPFFRGDCIWEKGCNPTALLALRETMAQYPGHFVITCRWGRGCTDHFRVLWMGFDPNQKDPKYRLILCRVSHYVGAIIGSRVNKEDEIALGGGNYSKPDSIMSSLYYYLDQKVHPSESTHFQVLR